ncbi:MAG TPA: DUF4157 domain-containing protein [Chloroflexia bacterium]|nr:DUF4157 domain-containing protein [Chloroflexia bacterium]
MSTSDSHEAIEKARRRAKERGKKAERCHEGEDSDLRSEAPVLSLPSHYRSLLGDSRLSESSNASVRAEVMHSAQKTHGNRAVQRFLQVQRSPTYAEEVTDDKIAQQISSKSGTGEKLDDPVRAQLERDLGTNLSHLQVHTDAEADHMARSVKATAFTSGRDIYFQAGSFDPRNPEGMKLLAHEAAHVMQQSKGPVDGKPTDAGITLSDSTDTFEQEAERISDEMESKWNHEGEGTQGGEAHTHEQVQRSQLEDAAPTLFNSSTLFVQRSPQTYANRAVQRFLQGSMPVQRCGDTPCGCSDEEKIQHALHEHGHEMAPVSRMADLRLLGMPIQRSLPVQRQPPPAPPDPNYTGTRGGDAYVGPGGGAGIGGLVSYGCYCGPGGDPVTGSRCGVGAPPKDAIDAKCMRHDSDYNKAGVDSGSTPGTVNMFTDFQGWLKSEEADRRLADTVDAEMDANPGDYSPSARLYGQGIKGIFGGRANVSHAMNWGMNKYGEAEEGLTGAYDDVTNWGGNKASEAEKGIEGFMKSASGWSSAGDVASGLLGGAADAANWLGKTGSEAFGGVGKALGSAGSWLGDTLGSAAMGVGEAALGMGEWGLETAGALGNVGLDLAGRGINAVGGAIGGAASAVGGAVSGAAGWAGDTAKDVWEDLTSWF